MYHQYSERHISHPLHPPPPQTTLPASDTPATTSHDTSSISDTSPTPATTFYKPTTVQSTYQWSVPYHFTWKMGDSVPESTLASLTDRQRVQLTQATITGKLGQIQMGDKEVRVFFSCFFPFQLN